MMVSSCLQIKSVLLQYITLLYHVSINPHALALLPEDGDISGLCSMTLESSDDDQELSSAQDEDPYDAHLTRTFVPIPNNRLTEEETVRQSVQDRVTSPMPFLPQSCGLQPVQLPSTSSTQKGTFRVPSPPCNDSVNNSVGTLSVTVSNLRHVKLIQLSLYTSHP